MILFAACVNNNIVVGDLPQRTTVLTNSQARNELMGARKSGIN